MIGETKIDDTFTCKTTRLLLEEVNLHREEECFCM